MDGLFNSIGVASPKQMGLLIVLIICLIFLAIGVTQMINSVIDNTPAGNYAVPITGAGLVGLIAVNYFV